MSDEKDIKAKLKSCKEIIQNKEYKQALKECQEILKLDSNNYMALVFSGLCHTELNDSIEARKCYEKATACQPDQILAWQGFVQFYEKFALLDDNYIRCLTNLRELTKDALKQAELTSKLAKVYAKCNKTNEALQECLNLLSSTSDSKKAEYELLTINCSKNVELENSNYIDLVSKCYKNRISDISQEKAVRQEFGAEFCHFLLKQKMFEEAYNVAKNLCQNDEASTTVLSIVIDELILRFAGDTFDNMKDLATLNSVLEKLENESNSQENDDDNDNTRNMFAIYLEAIKELIEGNFSEAIDALDDIDENNQTKEYFTLSSMANYLLGNHGESLLYTEKCLNLLDSANVRHRSYRIRMNFIKAECLFYLNDDDIRAFPRINASDILKQYEDVLKMCNNNDGEIRKNITQFCRLGMAKCEFVINEKRISDLVTNLLNSCSKEGVEYFTTLAYIRMKMGEFVEAANFARKVIEVDPKSSFHRLLLGRILWNSGFKTVETMKEFLDAAHLNTNSWLSFYYLALCQMEIHHNQQKALQCLERSMVLLAALNLHNIECVGRTLADLYKSLNMAQKYSDLLKSVVEKFDPDEAYWAWFRFGTDLLTTGQIDQCISKFQTLLRFHPNSIECWEYLADAYNSRGSYESALKVYEKILEFQPNSLHALYRIASVNLTLNMFDEAALKFEEILTKFEPNFLPAVIGLVRSLFASSKFYFERARYSRSLIIRRKCLKILTSFSKNSNLTTTNSSCAFWTIFGDVLTSLSEFDEVSLAPFKQDFEQLIPNSNLDKQEEKNVSSKFMLQILQFGAQCYMRALKVRPDVADFWYQLGLNFYCQASIEPSCTAKSVESVKQAIRLSPKISKYWSCLGVIMAKSARSKESLAFAQHCFVKALNIDQRDGSAWTNLGVFYLSQDSVNLAHECFKRAQSVDPEMAKAWIGQALIAEIYAPEEAMDLFRHSSELENHPEAMVGYANHVIKTIIDTTIDHTSAQYSYIIDHLFAVPMARDCMQRYCEIRPNDFHATNMLGILYEQEGMFHSAKDMFLKSLELYHNKQTGVAHSEVNCDDLIINICRVAGKLKDKDLFLKQLSTLTKKRSTEELCLLGLSMYRLGLFDQSIKAYLEASNESGSLEDRLLSKVCQCFGIMQKDGVHAAMKFYKECSFQENLSPVVLLLLVLHGKNGDVDFNVIKNSISTLLSNGPVELNRLLILFLLFQPKLTISSKIGCWLVHKHPHLINSWFLLIKTLNEKSALQCKIMQRIGRTDACYRSDNLIRAKCIYSFHEKDSNLEIERIVHQYPDLYQQLNIKKN